MTAPNLDALAALLDKATPGPWDDCGAWVTPSHRKFTESRDENAALIVALRNAAPALLAYVRELELEIDAGKGAYAKLFRDTHAAALVMRERAAQACEELSAEWFPRDKHEAAREGAIMRCAAAVRALEP